MHYEEFIGKVRKRARLGTTEQAEAAVRATLETLAERLGGREGEQLAAQLPAELASFMQPAYTGFSTSYSLDEFFRVVSEREQVPLSESDFHARVVIGLLSEVVTMGEIEDVRAQLPADFARLFAVENEGELPELGEIVEEGE